MGRSKGEVQSFITENYYTCTKEILSGLSQMYVDDERFKHNIDQVGGEGTAEFVRQAASVFALESKHRLLSKKQEAKTRMDENRIENFEKMLSDVQRNYEDTVLKMEKLKAEGKTKSATYRQLMGNKMTYQSMLSMYRIYGLIVDE